MSEQALDLSKAAQDLVELIANQPGAVVSRVLINKPAGTVTLFAFGAGEGLSQHAAPYDALVHVLEGQAKGYGPNNQFEMIPVLDALQNTAEWELALELSRDMYRKQLSTQTSLCSLWLGKTEADGLPEASKAELLEFIQHLGC